MLKKVTEWFKQLFVYPPELKEMQRKALETNRIYQQALDKTKQAPKPAVKRKPALKRHLQGVLKWQLQRNQ